MALHLLFRCLQCAVYGLRFRVRVQGSRFPNPQCLPITTHTTRAYPLLLVRTFYCSCVTFTTRAYPLLLVRTLYYSCLPLTTRLAGPAYYHGETVGRASVCAGM